MGSGCASAGSSGARGNTTRKVAPRPGAEFDLGPAPVGLGDGRHDRQPQAAASAGPRPRRIGAEEALEHPLGVVRREARAAVGHLHHGLLALGAHANSHGGAPRRVGPRVAQQVAHHLAQADVVPLHHDRSPLVEVDGPVGLDHAGVGDQVPHERPQVDAAALQRAPLVEPRQQQQVVDQHPHALGLLLDPAHGRLEVGRPLRGPAAEELGVAPHRGQRGLELVGGVPHELAQPPLGLAPLGEGLLDAGEHDVQRAPEAADLGARVLVLDALGEVTGRDGVGRGADAVEGPQPQAHQPPGQGAERRQGGCAHRQLDPEEPSEGVVDVAQRHPDHQRAVRREHARRQARLPRRAARHGERAVLARAGDVDVGVALGDVRRHLQRRGRCAAQLEAAHHRSVGVADLHERAGRQRRRRNAPSGPPQVGRVGLDGQARGRQAGAGQLVVHAIHQEAAQGLVGGPPGGRQGHGHHRQRDQQQAGAQRHGRGYLWRRRSE